MSFVKFPKIGQFRDVIRHVRERHDFKCCDESGKAVYEHTEDYPTLKFSGTVKMHGTNASIVLDENRVVTVQDRRRVIRVGVDDNVGFASFVESLPDSIFQQFPTNHAIFGEWCGSNIQKGVALNQLPKMFVIFAVKNIESGDWLDINANPLFDEEFLELLNSYQIYLSSQFGTFDIVIDFNNPELISPLLSDITNSVETECPVGKFFGVSGVGEGAVWNLDGSRTSDYRFKVKGEKHSVSKVKTLAPVDIAKLATVKEFVDMVVTEQRLEQGIAVLVEQGVPIERKSTGDFMRWFINDVMSEESDQLTGNGLNAKDVGSAISAAIKPFWFRQTDAV